LFCCLTIVSYILKLDTKLKIEKVFRSVFEYSQYLHRILSLIYYMENMTTAAASFSDNITGLRKHTTMRSTSILPEDFVLSSCDVLCGRGSHCFNHEGNRKFRKLVASRLQRYSSASTKHDKTQIICEIIDQVREDSPSGGFVKRDLETGRYYEVGDFHAVSAIVATETSLISKSCSYTSCIFLSAKKHLRHFVMPCRRSTNPATSPEKSFANVCIIAILACQPRLRAVTFKYLPHQAGTLHFNGHPNCKKVLQSGMDQVRYGAKN
jgi:hypothetical protein